MKKSILVFAAILTTLTAFSYIKWNAIHTPDKKNGCKEVSKTGREKTENIRPAYLPTAPKFYYGLGPRFSAIKKSDVNKATSVWAFFSEYDRENIVSLESVNIIIIVDDKQTPIQAEGKSENLTPAQIKLLRNADYSTNIKISSDCQTKNWASGKLQNSYYSPHLTIVPEKQASYAKGKDALVAYLRENNRNYTYGLDPKKLAPAKLYFTVTKNGTIENLRLPQSCGYSKVDQNVMKLLQAAPGQWIPAENAAGEKVDQELVITFAQGGC